MITHRKLLVLHNREVCENGENLKFLRQNEFISEDGYITVEGNSGFLNYLCRLIIILYYSVPSCPECKSPHSSFVYYETWFKRRDRRTEDNEEINSYP
jgi:hypothetical protein